MPSAWLGWGASLEGLENSGSDWVKLEVLGDKKTLLPDPVATLEATAQRQRGLSSPVLHDRRSGDGPPAERGGSYLGDARGQPHRQRPGGAQSQ